MSLRAHARILLSLATLFLAVFASFAAEQTQTLSYQGRLDFSGAPANGPHDFRFALWDAASDGNLLAGPIVRDSLPVANGQFSTTLDFGAAAFAGGARWIEVSVRPTGSGNAHTTLAPRQQIGSIPYALFALSAPAAQLTGTVPDARLSENIPRFSDLITLSNNLAALIEASRANIPSGVTVASIDPADAALLGQGMANIVRIPAPAWSSGATANQPTARSGHSAIWTGDQFIVWGGLAGAGMPLASGGLYQPSADRWTTISTILAPAARTDHTAIWTGSEMIVWGGFGAAGFLGNGARFEPSLQRWAATSNVNAPSERTGHIALWTGARMIVFGGRNQSGLLNDLAAYDPVDNAWPALALPNSPEARHGATAIWTGSRILIWGGEGAAGPLANGAQLLFDQAGNPLSWQAMSSVNAPSARIGHTAVWIGSRLIVWGGSNRSNPLSDGAIYDPIADAWSALPSDNSPSARGGHLAVWTGSEMIVWGGVGAAGSLASGAAYDPAANRWRNLTNPGAPLARDHTGGAWTGSELIVFGGLSNRAPVSNLQRVDPQPAWHLYRKF